MSEEFIKKGYHVFEGLYAQSVDYLENAFEEWVEDAQKSEQNRPFRNYFRNHRFDRKIFSVLDEKIETVRTTICPDNDIYFHDASLTMRKSGNSFEHHVHLNETGGFVPLVIGLHGEYAGGLLRIFDIPKDWQPGDEDPPYDTLQVVLEYRHTPGSAIAIHPARYHEVTEITSGERLTLGLRSYILNEKYS